MAQPVVQDTRFGHFDQSGSPSRVGIVGEITRAKRGPHLGLLSDSTAQCIMESRQDEIVLVQKVDPASASPRQAGIPVAGEPKPSFIAMDRNSAGRKPVCKYAGIKTRRTVVNDLNLNLGAGFQLLQNAADRVFQMLGTWTPRRDHHGQERTLERLG